jgi:hypothetical protein
MFGSIGELIIWSPVKRDFTECHNPEISFCGRMKQVSERTGKSMMGGGRGETEGGWEVGGERAGGREGWRVGGQEGKGTLGRVGGSSEILNI